MQRSASTFILGFGLLALTAGSLVSRAAGPAGNNLSVASLNAAPARAGDARNCNDGQGSVRIRGCTEIIKSGRLFGKPISSKNLAIVYNNRANAFNDVKFHDRAIVDYGAAIGLNPGYANAYYNRGVVFSKTGQIARAIVDFDSAIKLDPDFAAAYFSRGNTYDARREYDRAIASFSAAILRDSGFATAYTNRGIVYEKTGDRVRAISDFRKALALDPADHVAKSNLARLGAVPRDRSAKVSQDNRRTF